MLDPQISVCHVSFLHQGIQCIYLSGQNTAASKIIFWYNLYIICAPELDCRSHDIYCWKTIFSTPFFTVAMAIQQTLYFDVIDYLETLYIQVAIAQ